MLVAPRNILSFCLIFPILISHNFCIGREKKDKKKQSINIEVVKKQSKDPSTEIESDSAGFSDFYHAGETLYDGFIHLKNGFCYFFPNKGKSLRQQEEALHRQEEELHKQNVSQKIKILLAEKELYESLKTHMFEEKNYRGIPNACEEAANNYAGVAGYEALEIMLEDFRQATH